MHTREIAFALDAHELPALLERLRAAFPALRQGVRRESALYLDTFDRRIQAGGGSLCASRGDDGLELRWERAGACARGRARELPAFACELPTGALREELGALVAPRRLLPLVEVERVIRELELKDGEEKTVARLRAFERGARAPGNPASQALPGALVVQPVRGYPQPSAELVRFLEDELGLNRHQASELDQALGVLGLPRVSARAESVPLDPELPALQATRAVLRQELDQLLLQEDGLRRDLDPEFLHDWRVALRRSRTGLRQMKRALPAPEVERFSVELRHYSGQSGALRDLDVFLADLARLGEGLALDELTAFAAQERAGEHARFAPLLEDERYRSFLADWRVFLEDQELGAAPPAASEPVLVHVTRRLERRRHVLFTHGKRLGPRSAHTELHALRIECKKLRYLLDLFRSLFRPADVEALVAAVKRFQGALGEANDAVVQMALLEGLAGRMHAEGRASAGTLLAIGRLQALLEGRRRRAVARFFRRLRAFREGPGPELFRALLRADPGGRGSGTRP